MIVLPFTASFAVLVTGRLVQLLALGAFVTADASLIVYLLGNKPFHSVEGKNDLPTHHIFHILHAEIQSWALAIIVATTRQCLKTKQLLLVTLSPQIQ